MIPIDQGKRLKELEKENIGLKGMLADEILRKELLKEALVKVVSPGHKRQTAESFVKQGKCRKRVACSHFWLHRIISKYEAKQPNAWLARLKTAVRKVSLANLEDG